MSQGSSSVFELLAQFLFVQDSPNGHWQLSEVLSFDKIASAFGGQLREGFVSRRGQEEYGNLLGLLTKDLRGLRPSPVRAGVLGYDYVVRSCVKVFRTLCQVQGEIRGNSKLSLF